MDDELVAAIRGMESIMSGMVSSSTAAKICGLSRFRLTSLAKQRRTLAVKTPLGWLFDPDQLPAPQINYPQNRRPKRTHVDTY